MPDRLIPFLFSSLIQELTGALSLSGTQLINSGIHYFFPSFTLILQLQCVQASRTIWTMISAYGE